MLRGAKEICHADKSLRIPDRSTCRSDPSGGVVATAITGRESTVLESLGFENVGPAPRLEIEFHERLNFLAGDNGLGKTFLLDVAWWALIGTWARGLVVPQLRRARVRGSPVLHDPQSPVPAPCRMTVRRADMSCAVFDGGLQ